MKSATVALITTFVVAASTTAWAEDDMGMSGMGGKGAAPGMRGMEHGAMGAMKGAKAGKPAAHAGAALAHGEVQAIAREAGTITIKHGPVPSMDMPGMTMVYGVQSRELLENLEPGDKVRYAAKNIGGTLAVTRLEAAK